MVHCERHYGPVSVLSKPKELLLIIICKEITSKLCNHSITTQYRAVFHFPLLLYIANKALIFALILPSLYQVTAASYSVLTKLCT